MEKYKELKNKLCEELSRFNSRDISASNLDTIDKLAHTIKCIDAIEKSEEGGSYRGSYRGSYESYEGGSNRSYEGESGAGYRSYRRDSMGRYARDGYSRDGVLDHLYAMMEQAHTEKEKNDIRRAIEAMEK